MRVFFCTARSPFVLQQHRISHGTAHARTFGGNEGGVVSNLNSEHAAVAVEETYRCIVRGFPWHSVP